MSEQITLDPKKWYNEKGFNVGIESTIRTDSSK